MVWTPHFSEIRGLCWIKFSTKMLHLFSRIFEYEKKFLKKYFGSWYDFVITIWKIQKESFSQPSRGRPVRADRGEAHLNDVRFNSNWVFFTHDDCLKIDIQYWKSLKIPKFGLTEGVIFNSENGKLSCSEKWWYRQISEMGRENSKKFSRIASCGP